MFVRDLLEESLNQKNEEVFTLGIPSGFPRAFRFCLFSTFLLEGMLSWLKKAQIWHYLVPIHSVTCLQYHHDRSSSWSDVFRLL